MQIVIDIPEKLYNAVTHIEFDASLVVDEMRKSIANGAPLPKSHGRLIDADSLQKKYCDDNCGVRKCVDAMDRCVFVDAVLYAPTIIEAGKEGEDGD